VAVRHHEHMILLQFQCYLNISRMDMMKVWYYCCVAIRVI
jgi:hypothetical protein